MTRFASLLLIATALSACATSGAESPGLRPAPPTWTEATGSDAPAAPASATVGGEWWRAYNDPALLRIVELTEAGDDIPLAIARLDEALAGFKGARAELLPSVSATGLAETGRQGDAPPRVDTFSGGLAASWTPDLFGQTRLRARAAAARARASEADLAAVRLDTRNAAVQLYIAFRNAQGQARAAESNVRSLADTLEIVEARHAAGIVPELDLAQARAALAAARAEPFARRQAATATRLRLEALLGLSPGALASELGDGALPPVASISATALAPVSVIARRPDLRNAELGLEAAGFDSRAARRDFWPTITIDTLIGGQDVSPAFPFTGGGLVYNAAGSIAAPILTFGRLEAARDGADARRRAAAIAYRQAATRALSEVETAFAAGAEAAARAETLSLALAAARDQTALARSRYTAGLSPLLEVLVAERAAFDAEAAFVAATADAGAAFADLNAAMGLGGDAPATPANARATGAELAQRKTDANSGA